MKLTKLAIGLAAVLAFSAQANAGGLVGPGNVGILNLGVTTFGNMVASGAFTDDYEFTISSASTYSSSATSNPLTMVFGGMKYNLADISGLILTLYSVNDSFIMTKVAGGGSSFIDSVTLNSGVYYDLKITGTGTGLNGGVYSGAMAVAAVPEPTDGALMLSGMGLLGFIAARRSRKA